MSCEGKREQPSHRPLWASWFWNNCGLDLANVWLLSRLLSLFLTEDTVQHTQNQTNHPCFSTSAAKDWVLAWDLCPNQMCTSFVFSLITSGLSFASWRPKDSLEPWLSVNTRNELWRGSWHTCKAKNVYCSGMGNLNRDLIPAICFRMSALVTLKKPEYNLAWRLHDDQVFFLYIYNF